MKSTLYTINWKDFGRGLIIAVGTAIFPIIMQSLNQNELVFNWKLIATTGLGAFITYMTKSFFTDDTKSAYKTLSKQNVTIIDHAPAPEVNYSQPKQ